jgi:hypothetical protein
MTPNKLHKTIKAANALLIPYMTALADRWEDEREYEDWADYVKALTVKVIEQGFTHIRITKRPFGFRAQHPSTPDRVFIYKITETQILINSVKVS